MARHRADALGHCVGLIGGILITRYRRPIREVVGEAGDRYKGFAITARYWQNKAMRV